MPAAFLRPSLPACVLAVGVLASACTTSVSAAPAPDGVGCVSDSGQTPRSTGPSTAVTTTFAVVGDSITAGTGEHDGPTQPGTQSWLRGAEGPPLQLVGGWAVPGTTTAQMRAGVGPLPADVLVVMAGTNDLRDGTAWEVSGDNLEAIVAQSGDPGVLLSSVPPYDPAPAASVAYNRHLEEFAAAEGWRFVDPWSTCSDDGAWVAGASADGVHPRPQVAERVGRELRALLLTGPGR